MLKRSLRTGKSVTLCFSGSVQEAVSLYIEKKSYSEVSKVLNKLVILHTCRHITRCSPIGVRRGAIFGMTQGTVDGDERLETR
ncbi:hypothetical protein VULLAG_LOCUS19700 [Vulpes lagopus]